MNFIGEGGIFIHFLEFICYILTIIEGGFFGRRGWRKSYTALASFRPCPWPRGGYVIIFLSGIKKLIFMLAKNAKPNQTEARDSQHFRI